MIILNVLLVLLFLSCVFILDVLNATGFGALLLGFGVSKGDSHGSSVIPLLRFDLDRLVVFGRLAGLVLFGLLELLSESFFGLKLEMPCCLYMTGVCKGVSGSDPPLLGTLLVIINNFA